MHHPAPTVLVADDSPAYRQALAGYLRSRGCDVVCAADGEEALRLLRERKIDLVVCDLLMPRLGGERLVAQIRADERLRDTPVIIASAAYSPAVERELRPAVQGWLTKSQVSLADTLECVGLHLAMAAAGAPRPRDVIRFASRHPAPRAALGRSFAHLDSCVQALH